MFPQYPHRAHLQRGRHPAYAQPPPSPTMSLDGAAASHHQQPLMPPPPPSASAHHRVRTIIAVHYGAMRPRDASMPAHVRNVDWQPSKWVNRLAMDRFFQMSDGAVRVRKSGLYQVYAQVRSQTALI